MIERVLTMRALPPTLNQIIASARGNKFASAAVKKKWTDGIALACHQAKVQPISGIVFLEYIWRVKNFQRDSDNITSSQKYILDGLVAANVIEQDNLTVIKSPVIHHFEKSDHDGFSIFIRDEAAWLERAWKIAMTDLPVITSETVLEVLTETGNATRKRKAPARARARTRASISRRT